jgi:DNA-binding LytR/AlgR family response regulator
MTDIKKIRCLVVDDEPPALEVLKNYISAISLLELVGTCNNAVEAIGMISHEKIELLFLDIQMPQLLGTNLIRSLNNPPKVIFTTAYRKFALEGFELNAVDYLLKPISFERFLKAVNKVMNISLPVSSDNYNVNVSHSTSQDPFITFRADRKMYKVALDDIVYVESMKDYIKIVTTNNTIITKQSISSLEESLPVNLFIRIHRSFIVSISKIQSYTAELVAIGKVELPVSRTYRHEVERILK